MRGPLILGKEKITSRKATTSNSLEMNGNRKNAVRYKLTPKRMMKPVP
jgi:hypothetical protein